MIIVRRKSNGDITVIGTQSIKRYCQEHKTEYIPAPGRKYHCQMEANKAIALYRKPATRLTVEEVREVISNAGHVD